MMAEPKFTLGQRAADALADGGYLKHAHDGAMDYIAKLIDKETAALSRAEGRAE